MGKPKIRFKGYTDEWEEKKFGKLVEKYEDPVKTPTEGYMRLGIRSHAKGTFHSYVEKGKELETAKMFRVAANKFIVNITFGWEHAVAITDEKDAGKLVSHRFPQYSFNEGMIPKFFKYLILDENFKHHLEISSPGGAGRNRVLKLGDMLEYKMIYPSSEEQKKIAKFFDKLDCLITFHQRKYEEAKILKKYMLQKMFPQKGMNVPEIRFNGFTDAWEQRKVGELVVNHNAGIYISKENYGSGINVIGVGNIYDNDIYDGEIYKLGPVSDSKFLLEENDLIYGESSLVPEGIARTVCVGKNGVGTAFAWHTRRVKLNQNSVNSHFATLELNYHPEIRKYLMSVSTQTALTGMTTDGYFGATLFLPTVEEQDMISSLFKSLDHLITLHQRKCDELKKVKKFMLQNMFPQD